MSMPLGRDIPLDKNPTVSLKICFSLLFTIIGSEGFQTINTSRPSRVDNGHAFLPGQLLREIRCNVAIPGMQDSAFEFCRLLETARDKR